MSDDERLARLTELAQRVYGEGATVHLGHRGADPWTAYLMHDESEMLTVHARGPRALDALEAALLVLLKP